MGDIVNMDRIQIEMTNTCKNCEQAFSSLEGYLKCHICHCSFHMRCAKLFQNEIYYEVLVGDFYFQYTCQGCTLENGVTVFQEDRLIRLKLTWNDAVLILLRYMEVAMPDVGIHRPWSIERHGIDVKKFPDIVFHWSTILQQLKHHWDKFWPLRRKEVASLPADHCPSQLSSALTTQCTGTEPPLCNAHRAYLLYQNQHATKEESLLLDPSNCQFQGYYGLINKTSHLSREFTKLLGHRITLKNGEFVYTSVNNSERIQFAASDTVDNQAANSLSSAQPTQASQISAKKLKNIILTNMDFDRPNPPISTPVKISRQSTHTHPHIKISDDGKSISHTRVRRISHIVSAYS